MDAPLRGALMLVRFIAVALIGLGVVELVWAGWNVPPTTRPENF
jgi:hypothetical protein